MSTTSPARRVDAMLALAILLIGLVSVTVILGSDASSASDPNFSDETADGSSSGTGDGSGTDAKRDGASGADGSAPAPPDPRTIGNRLSLLGDAVMAAGAPSVPAIMPEWAVWANAQPGRTTADTLQFIQANRASMGDVVVLHTGTHDQISPDAYANLVDATDAVLHGVPLVMWVTLADGGESTGFNEVIAKLPNDNPDVAVIDWATESAGHPEYFDSEANLSPVGRTAFGDFIARSVSAEMSARGLTAAGPPAAAALEVTGEPTEVAPTDPAAPAATPPLDGVPPAESERPEPVPTDPALAVPAVPEPAPTETGNPEPVASATPAEPVALEAAVTSPLPQPLPAIPAG